MTKSQAFHLSGTILLLVLAIVATASPATAAPNGRLAVSGLASGWRYADFDGDYKPDLVELRPTHLNLRLSTGKELHLASVLDATIPGTEIVVVDLDGDRDLDIVVRNRFLQQHSDIWLNDGEGFFSKSATRDFSLPPERGSWTQSPTPEPGIAITVKNSKPLAILCDSWFLSLPASDGNLRSVRTVLPAKDHTDTAQLRGPPISTVC
ncbi:MAG TPA: VCBS repeat-containing protein [Terriglobia bacterium]|nr:VCBS repeat-containing protein [Terriglobia bacterium]